MISCIFGLFQPHCQALPAQRQGRELETVPLRAAQAAGPGCPADHEINSPPKLKDCNAFGLLQVLLGFLLASFAPSAARKSLPGQGRLLPPATSEATQAADKPFFHQVMSLPGLYPCRQHRRAARSVLGALVAMGF